MRPQPLTTKQFRLYVEDVRDLAHRLGKVEPTLRKRAFGTQPRGDSSAGIPESDGIGFPPGHSGGRRGPTILVEADRHGPREELDASPVEVVVLNGQSIDPVRAAHDNVVDAVRRARDLLTAAWNEYDSTTRDSEKRAIQLQEPDPVWCTIHQEAGLLEPRGADGAGRKDLCRFCDGFVRNFGQDPPPAILDLRAQGRRITRQLIALYCPSLRV